jgi:LPXTG-site transpeptidase (sortase) family protein
MQKTSRVQSRYTRRSQPASRGRTAHRKVDRPYAQRASIKRKVLYEYEATKKAVAKRLLVVKLAFPAMACLVFGVGLHVAVQGQEVNQQVEAQVEVLAQQATDPDSEPVSEEEPDTATVGAYTVPANLPRYLSIPKYGKKSRVLNLGLKANSEIDTPKNIYDTAWYNGSALPGSAGTSFISGHVHGPSVPGVFYHLKDLVAGDEVMVEMGDGRNFTYSVVDAASYSHDAVDMGFAFSSPGGASSLTLITCSGSVISGTTDYTDRHVVRAVLK